MPFFAEKEALALEAPEDDSTVISGNGKHDTATEPMSTLRKLLLSFDAPLLLFLTNDSLFIHCGRQPRQKENFKERIPSWLQVSYSLPLLHSFITNAWSAGPRLLVLLGSALSPFHPGYVSLWNPLSSSLARLPPFASVWHLITLGYGDNLVVAAGFDCNIQCVIEVVHIDQTSSPIWRIVGRLPLSFNVGEHAEILYCRGAFYALCMESSMLVIDPLTEKLTLHGIPSSSAPKLIACCDNIFMVDGNLFSVTFQLWKFHSDRGHWQAELMNCPYVQKSPSKLAAVKGIGTSIYFILTGSSILVYEVLSCEWHFATERSFPAIKRPLSWQPAID